MPLEHSSSDKAFKTNVRTLMGEIGKSPHVKSRKQALAIAFETQRRGKANGGKIAGFAEGGDVPPLQITPNIAARMQRRVDRAGSDDALKRVVGDAARYGVDWSHLLTPGILSGKAAGGKIAGFAGGGRGGPVESWYPPDNKFADPIDVPPPSGLNNLGPVYLQDDLRRAQGMLSPETYGKWLQSIPPDQIMNTENRASGGKIPGFALGGQLPSLHTLPDRFTRQAMHGLATPKIHIGAIGGNTMGRGDKIPMHVASGSYVFPADHVSHLGDGNTAAGFKTLGNMFGKVGPYGAKIMSTHNHGIGMPRLAGGGHFSPTGKPTPIMAADGEYVVHPSQIIRKFGNLKRGHEALDEWVKYERKEHIDRLKKLPGPAKK